MIDSTACVSPDAQLGEDVVIGPLTVVHGNAVIGARSSIGSHCSIGVPTPLAVGKRLEIGEGANIRSHAVVYEGSTFGERLETGHHVTLREGLKVGKNLRVGTGADLLGSSMIGDYVRLHSGVFVCQGATIGDYVWVYVNTILTDDPHPPNDDCLVGPTIEDYAVVAANCCIGPGVRIGRGAVVGASSMVTRDVGPGKLALGVPAREIGEASDVKLRDGTDRPAYPWTQHFRRGYPDDVASGWDER